MSVEAEFIGGPQDGLIQALPGLRNYHLFPAGPGLTFTLPPDDGLEARGGLREATANISMTCSVYEVELDPVMRRPRPGINGRYRYRYQGTRPI